MDKRTDVIFDKCLVDIFAAGRKAKRSVIVEAPIVSPAEEMFAKVAKGVNN